MDITVFSIVVAVVLGLAVLWWVLRHGKGTTSSMGIFRKRNKYLLVGLCNSGKTQLLLKLSGRDVPPSTVTSMQPNELPVDIDGGSIMVTDFPGHRRLRDGMFPFLQEAKKLIIAVDSLTIQDKENGAAAVCPLLVAILESPACRGVQTILVACTKRDVITSFSSKAVRRQLESEMTQLLSNQAGGVKKLEGPVTKRKTHQDENDDERDVTLFLRDDGKFSFDDVPIPVAFADCTAVADSPGIAAVVEFLST